MLDCFTRLLLRLSVLSTLFAMLLRAGTASASTMITGGNLGNQTWTPAGSPYIVTGDSTVQVGATLTIQPGVTVQLAAGDSQAAGIDHFRTELTIQGTLDAVGTAAAPITIKAQGASAAQVWYGIIIEPTATATIGHATIQDADHSVVSSAPGTQFSLSNSALSSTIIAVTVKAGTPTLDHLMITGMVNGITFSGAGGGTVSNTVLSGAKNYGINTNAMTASSTVTVVNTVVKSSPFEGIAAYGPTSGTLTVAILNSTIQGNATGVSAWAPDAGQTTMTIKNSIITQGIYYGVRRGTDGTVNVTTTYSDVWGNGTDYSNTVAGVGCISQNPNYVSAPSNLALQSSSVCIDTGTSMGAPAKDLLGVARPINGDGLGAAEFDMGAYEYVPAAFCGDGVVSMGEACDSGAQNGTYGNCKSDCSGAGPSCGDGITNGPEACDDGNPVDTDACKSDCTAAKCGDGVVSTGEECDDENQIDTDACLTTCVAAKCGDSFAQAGVEECDDGNSANGDGCSSQCLIESASTATGAGGGMSSGVTGAGGGMSSGVTGAGGDMISGVTGAGGGSSGSSDTSGGCGCRTAVGEEESSPSWLLFAAAVVAIRRRRTGGARPLA